MTPLRAGVCGLGTMGRHHARVLAAMPGVHLVAACDPDRSAGAAAPSLRVLPDLDQMLALDLDICVVAAPTMAHAEIGARLAEAGVHTLIEKPLAASAEEARTLAAAFERAGLVGCVGHIERFNPVVRAMRERIGRGEIGAVRQITTSRQGPYPQRIRDVGVILDLASHDIDLTRWIARSPYLKVSAVTSQVLDGSGHEDMAAVAGVLEDGTVVNHLVNWLSPVKERLVTVTGELGCLRGDLLDRTLRLYRCDQGSATSPADDRATPCEVGTEEPLRIQLEGLVDAVRGNDDGIVTMRAGAEVVEVTSAILAAPWAGVEVPATDRTANPVRPGTGPAATVVPAQPNTDRTAAPKTPRQRPPSAAAPAGPPAGPDGVLPVLVAGYVLAPGSRRFF